MNYRNRRQHKMESDPSFLANCCRTPYTCEFVSVFAMYTQCLIYL